MATNFTKSCQLGGNSAKFEAFIVNSLPIHTRKKVGVYNRLPKLHADNFGIGPPLTVPLCTSSVIMPFLCFQMLFHFTLNSIHLQRLVLGGLRVRWWGVLRPVPTLPGVGGSRCRTASALSLPKIRRIRLRA